MTGDRRLFPRPQFLDVLLLVEEVDDFAAVAVVVGMVHHFHPLAGPGNVHFQNLADVGLWPIGQHDDAIGEQDGFIDFVGHHDRRYMVFFADLHQLFLQVATGKGIQRPKRFIQQQQLGLDGKGTGDRHPLLHPPRQLIGWLVCRVAQSHHVNVAFHNLLTFVGRQVTQHIVHRQGNVLPHRHPRQQRIVLEHHHAIGAGTEDLFPLQHHQPIGGQIQPRHHVQQRGLATTRVAN